MMSAVFRAIFLRASDLSSRLNCLSSVADSRQVNVLPSVRPGALEE